MIIIIINIIITTIIIDLPGPLCYYNFLNVDLTVIYIFILLIIKLNIT